MKNPQIHEVLSAKGVTYDEVAKLLEWPLEKLQELATTSKDVSEKELMKIANLLDVEISAFFNDNYKKLVN